MKEVGVENFKIPQIGGKNLRPAESKPAIPNLFPLTISLLYVGKELDLYKLYKAVIARGGSTRVSNNKLWREIVNEFGLPASCTSASFTLRNHYGKCLYEYEKKFFHGNADDGFDNLTESKFQKGLGHIPYDLIASMGAGPALGPSTGFAQPGLFGASVNLHLKNLNSHPVHIQNTEAESKRLALAFESRIPTEITWALNTLCVFSCNTVAPFHFDSHPFLLEAMCNYVVFALRHVRSLSYENVVEKASTVVQTSVPSITDNPSAGTAAAALKIEYRGFPAFSE